MSRREQYTCTVERDDDLVEHDQRWRDLAALDLGDHALVAADRLRQVAHQHALQDTRMADAGADLQMAGTGIRCPSCSCATHSDVSPGNIG